MPLVGWPGSCFPQQVRNRLVLLELRKLERRSALTILLLKGHATLDQKGDEFFIFRIDRTVQQRNVVRSQTFQLGPLLQEILHRFKLSGSRRETQGSGEVPIIFLRKPGSWSVRTRLESSVHIQPSQFQTQLHSCHIAIAGPALKKPCKMRLVLIPNRLLKVLKKGFQHRSVRTLPDTSQERREFILFAEVL